MPEAVVLLVSFFLLFSLAILSNYLQNNKRSQCFTASHFMSNRTFKGVFTSYACLRSDFMEAWTSKRHFKNIINIEKPVQVRR